MNYLENCQLCPRNCKINRYVDKGFCQAGSDMYIARADLHFYEEPVISGDNGSGTIFFSYCNLKCIYCQNFQISTLNVGKAVSIQKFSDICLNLQNDGAHNINLVTPTHYAPLIKDGILLAKKKGLVIPVVYNTSSYENVDTIKMMKDVCDIYLADLKYFDNFLGVKYSSCNDYFKYASLAINEMYKQVGAVSLDNNGMMKKGVIVRHLLLPGHLDDSKKIIKYLYDTYGDNIFISIMNQYTPIKKLKYDNLNRCVSDEEYDELVSYACDLGITNAFIQVGETQKKSFIPDFNNQEF